MATTARPTASRQTTSNSLKPPKDNNLKRINSYTWPAGHVGHLSDSQTSALEKFKQLCQEKGYYTPSKDSTPASHDDETMLRYLRARKFVPNDAFTQFKDTEDWRQETGLENLYETIDIQEYEATRRLYPQWTGRRDNRGIPLYVFEVANLNTKALTAYEKDDDAKAKKADKKSKAPKKMIRLFALYENMCRFVLPLCAAIPNRPNIETPVSQSSNIVDISKVSLRQFWNLRGHLQDSSALATAHYPETLDRIFVIGAPGFFNVIWDWAKSWFDPITVAKIQIVPDKQMLETLSRFIPVENIPKKYGGKLDWSFGDMPHLEADIANAMRWKDETMERNFKTFPIGPIKWMHDDEGDLVAMAIGSEGGQKRQNVVAGLHLENGVTPLALSPGRVEKGADHIDSSVAGINSKAANGQTKSTSSPNTTTNNASSQQGITAAAATTTAAATTAAAPTTSPTSPTSTTSDSLPSHPNGTHPEIAIHNPSPDRSTSDLAHRQGTSATKFVQQNDTYAEGQAANNTPNTTLDGQGSRQAVVETRTVGQAPKEVGLPTPAPAAEGEVVKPDAGGQAKDDQVNGVGEEQSNGGIVETVKASVGGAVDAVAAYVPDSVAAYVPAGVAHAVGLDAGQGEEVKEEVKPREKDSRVQEMDPRMVEEVLRVQSMTKPGIH
ncbi:unnamed protein product [Zymoseptoria tritici ST99CH_3D1]|nr:unnamed protein product [Zymoseptoria tritici ST99CH_3D1]